MRPDRRKRNRLFLYTQKTDTPVYCVFPDFVVKYALDATPRTSERFYFWSGASTLHSAVGKWQRRLKRLFKLAEVPRVMLTDSATLLRANSSVPACRWTESPCCSAIRASV
jgi:hypothetical protein